MNAAARACTIALLLLCIVPAPAAAQPAPALTTVRVGVLPNDDMIALLYGVRTGRFVKAGFDVEIDRSASNGAAIAAAVTGGSLDIGKSSLQTLIEAHIHNVPFWLIATAAVYDSRAPYAGLLVLKDSPYTKTTDIQSGVVGLSSAKDVAQIALLKSLDDAGIKPTGVQFTEIPMSAGAAALEAGRTVAQEISYPLAQAAVDSGKFRFLPALDTFGKTYAFSVYFTTKDYAAKNAGVVKTFTRVLADAARFTNTGLSAQSCHEGPLRLQDPRRQPGHEPVRIKRAHVGARRPLLFRENPVEAKATFRIQVSASRLSMSSS